MQLAIAINFISSKDNDEQRVMHSKRDNIEIMDNGKVDQVIDKLFKSLQNRYENNLEHSVKGKEFVYDYVHLSYYKCHKKIQTVMDYIYVDMIKKKATRVPINKKNNKCFQQAVAVALNHEEIKKVPQRITKTKLHINKYNWE